jgi:ligand-binding SRPBCC domain-containing protein
MTIYRLIRKQYIPATVSEVWDFFSNPGNLAEITPEYMKFIVTSPPHTGDIYPGQIITYKVSPLLGIPLSWMTEITHVVPGKLFVDEQRQGPYSLWHHQHLFEPDGNGTLMTDIVHYKLPLGPLGALAKALFVGKQLEDIFDYRKKVIEEKFG